MLLVLLVPRLCLGTHCTRGSASRQSAMETRPLKAIPAGGACKAVGSKAEPRNSSIGRLAPFRLLRNCDGAIAISAKY